MCVCEREREREGEREKEERERECVCVCMSVCIYMYLNGGETLVKLVNLNVYVESAEVTGYSVYVHTCTNRITGSIAVCWVCTIISVWFYIVLHMYACRPVCGCFSSFFLLFCTA